MATISASGADSLLAALKTAQPGTTIELAGGNYGRLSINAQHSEPWGSFGGEVTIRSADQNNPATFSDIFLRGVNNLTFDGIVVDYKTPAGLTGAAALSYNPAVLVQESANVTIRNSVFDGDVHNAPGSLMDGLPVAQALFVRESTNIAVEDNEFLSWRGASLFQNTSGLVVSGNDVHTMRSEGLNLVAVQNVLIEGNHFHDFVTREGVGEHPDMIQFWTAGSRTPSTDIVIRENVLNSGSGVWTQSIFMRNDVVDSGLAGREMFYRNVVIENNVIYNAHYHGITVGETDGLRIINNTLLHNPDSGVEGTVSRPHITVVPNAINVHVEKNIAAGVPEPAGSSVGWRIANNLIAQDNAPDKPNYYGDLFINALTGGGEADLAALQALPGGLVERGGYGSSLTRFDPTPKTLTAVIRPESETDDVFRFDGGYTANPQGLVGSGATFQWDLGDGTVRQGVAIDHTYAKPGTYHVTLTATDAGGRTDSALAEAYVPEPVRLALDVTAQGLADISSYATSGLPWVQVVQDAGRYAARLADQTGFDVGRSAPIYDLDAFTISLDFRAISGAASAGDVFRIYNSLDLEVRENGSFAFGFINEAEQRFQLSSAPTKALDGGWHTVSVTYDKSYGELELLLDGVEVGTLAASGSTRPMEHWGLHFGSIWGRTGFDGLIDDFEIRDDPIAASPATPDEQPEPEAPPTNTPTFPTAADVTLFDFGSRDPAPNTRLVGDATVSRDGTLALNGGGGHLAVDHGGQPAFTGVFSVAFDVRFDKPLRTSDKVLLVSQHSQYAVELREGTIQAGVGTEGGGFAWAGRIDAAGLLDGEWHRVALSVDSETDVLRFYVDGEIVTERTDIDIELADSSRPLTFGAAGWSDYMTGEMDDIVLAGAVLDLDALM